MKSHRFHHKTEHHQTGADRARPWIRGGLLALLALTLMGLALVVAPGVHDEESATANVAMAYAVSAQESPLSPLSIAFNNGAPATKRAQPAAGDPNAGGPSNLLRVMIVIAGVLLVTGLVFWRQR